MGKEFVEQEDKCISYSPSTVCLCLAQYVKDYIKEDEQQKSSINKVIRDAVLVDVINYLADISYADFVLYTVELYDDKKYDEEHNETIDGNSLLTVVANQYACYANQGICQSVLKNGFRNDCSEKFDDEIGITILLAFINYLAKRNEFDIRFTKEALYKRFQNIDRRVNMIRFKLFLKNTEKYTKLLLSGKSSHNIYEEIAKNGVLDHISTRGIYYDINGDKMYMHDKQLLDNELYALGYAFSKLKSEGAITGNPEDKIVRAKIKEMKKR
jgi:hypothetical protein